MEAVADFIFLGSKITVDGDCHHEIRRRLLLVRKMTNLDNELKSRDITDKCPYSQGYGLPTDHVWLWDLDGKDGRMPKNWCLRTVVLEKTPESPLNSKEIKPVNLKGDQPWIFTGKTDAEAEAPVFWSSVVNRWHWKIPWYWERLRAEGEEGIRGERTGWHHRMQWTWIWAKLWELVRDREATCTAVHGTPNS